MTNNTLSPDALINAFAAAVRAELADLPADELDDLVGGLVADLTEQAADDGPAFDPGDPVTYARELRLAAGLPEHASAPPRPSVGERAAAWRSRVAVGIRSSRFGAGVLDLLVALRPVWWVLRGILLYFVATAIVAPYALRDFSPLRFLVLAALVLVSVQWGRGRWLPKNWLRHVRTMASVVAVLAILPAASVYLTPQIVYEDGGWGAPAEGLVLDGVQVGNLFAYDEQGNPIPHVRLFTDRGTPVNLYGGTSADRQSGEVGDDGTTATVPERDLLNQAVWNRYPLQVGRVDTDGSVDPSTTTSPTFPFERVPAPLSTGGATPEASPTTAPTSTVVPKPTPTPTPTPTG